MTVPNPTVPPAPSAIDVATSSFPWWRQLGIPIEKVQEWVASGLSGDSLYGEVTKTPQYQQMFMGLRRPDGTKRMDESAFLSRQDDYRTLLKQFADPSVDYGPADLAAFFEQDIAPDELKQRFDMYESVKRDQDVKDAFYVYAGMRPSDDELYYAIVSPTARKALEDEYNRNVAVSPLDYATWVTRATQAGLARVASRLGSMQEQGILTGTAVSQIQQVDPNFARQMMDQLYHGGDPSGSTTKLLNLDELMHSFEYAMIGSAASTNGFQLPDRDRLEAIRAAGVDRAKALQAYSDYASQKNLVSGEVQRAGYGEFGQNEFEKAVLLQQGQYAAILKQAAEGEKALGHSTGAAEFGKDRTTGRTTQYGLREALS